MDLTKVVPKLDLIALQLDRAGHSDLADKVDSCTSILLEASGNRDEVSKVIRVMSRIASEIDNRDEDTVDSGELAVRRAKRTEIKKKALKRGLRERAAHKMKAKRIMREARAKLSK